MVRTPRTRQLNSRSPALTLEALETRRLLSCTVGLDAGVLRVDCDDDADAITVDHPTPLVRVSVKKAPWLFAENEVTAVAINAGGGTDRITVDVGKSVTVNAQAGNDVVQVRSAAAGALTRVFCGTVPDRDRVEVGRAGGTLDNLSGGLSIFGLNGGPLLIHEEGSPLGHTYRIDTEGHVYRDGRDIFNYTNSAPGSVSVFAGAGPDTAVVGTVPGSRTFHYFLGGGNDTVRVRPADFFSQDILGLLNVSGGSGTDMVEIDERHNLFGSTYTVSTSSVHRRGTIGYAEVEGITLMGGDRNDRFLMAAAPTPALLTLQGGNGTDTLDYSGLASPVHVSLSDGTASGLVGLAGVENVLGSRAEDILRGDNNNNLLDGGAGHDILLGEAGVDSLVGGDGQDVLIGGTGTDRIEGGLGDDLLLSGTTSYDNDVAFLAALRAVWVCAEPYPIRVLLLRDYLYPATVTPDPVPDELLGQEGMDWFWGEATEVLDQEPEEFRN